MDCHLGFRLSRFVEKASDFGHLGLILEDMKTVANSPFLQTLTIQDVIGDANLTRRLREMGFHSGCEIRILSRAPFHGPYVVQLHDSVLALRGAEAECLLIR